MSAIGTRIKIQITSNARSVKSNSMLFHLGDSLNFDDVARQLQLPPGVAVFLGPHAVHAGSSTDGIRIHCTYDVQDLDAYDVHVNCYEKNATKWPEYHSDSNLTRVPWYDEALKVVSVRI